jgi:iron(II)-dependent oxidoreductase
MFNSTGIGFVPWENVWGVFNQLSDRDGEATRRVASLLRFAAPFLTSPEVMQT